MNLQDLRSQLIAIIVKGSARGTGETLTPAEAEVALDGMIQSDDHPAWDDIRQGREQMEMVVKGYLR